VLTVAWTLFLRCVVRERHPGRPGLADPLIGGGSPRPLPLIQARQITRFG